MSDQSNGPEDPVPVPQASESKPHSSDKTDNASTIEVGAQIGEEAAKAAGTEDAQSGGGMGALVGDDGSTLIDDSLASGSASTAAEWAAAEPRIEKWYIHAAEAQYAHFESAKVYDIYRNVLGAVTAVGGVIFGSSVFSDIAGASESLKIAKAVIGLLVAGLSSLISFFNYADRAAQHRRSAVRYSQIRRSIESACALQRESRGNVKSFLDACEQALNHANDAAMPLTSGMWQKTEQKFKKYPPSELFLPPRP